MPVIVGYHIVFSAYGFWLPNDPRGSWSDFVGSWDLFRFGRTTPIDDVRSNANVPHDRAMRVAAKESLKYPPVNFTGVQARAVERGFANYFQNAGLPVWACAILPEHVHLVVGQSAISVKQLVIQLKGEATRQLVAEGIHPFGHLTTKTGRPPKCFARGEWKVFLDPEDVPRAIEYVENNPEKEGKPRQRWPFVTKLC